MLNFTFYILYSKFIIQNLQLITYLSPTRHPSIISAQRVKAKATSSKGGLFTFLSGIENILPAGCYGLLEKIS